MYIKHVNNRNQLITFNFVKGKVQELDKPLVVITKEESDEVSHNSDVKYGVTAVIKKKMVFKTRPKPIVGETIKKL